MKKLGLVLVSMFILSGCGLFSGGNAGLENPKVKAAFSDANSAIKKSKSVNGEWRDAKKKFMKKAKAAASKGKIKKAIKLANHAKFQGEMGYTQALEQKKAGPWLF